MRGSLRPRMRAASAVERLWGIARPGAPLLRSALARRLLRGRLRARGLALRLAGLARALRQALLQRRDEVDDLLARGLGGLCDHLLARDLAVDRLHQLHPVAILVARRIEALAGELV